MKYAKHNIGYFIREARTIIKLNPISNLLSVFSIGLILFILVLVASGWYISNEAITAIQKEAEISLYFSEGLEPTAVAVLIENIEAAEGVEAAEMVTEEESYRQMAEILGKDAEVLAHFAENPFTAYIEVKLDIKAMDAVLEKLSELEGVDYIRDNREVLQSLMDIERALGLISYLVLAAVGTATLVIIAHLIRSGIYNNREEILTLRLLGAPEAFISIPFVLGGMLLTLGGGALAILLSSTVISLIYGQLMGPLPFIPLPQQGAVISNVVGLLIPFSLLLGLVGGFFGLKNL